MKAVLYKGQPNKVSIEDVEKPVINNEEVLVRVKYIGICGADIELIKGNRNIKIPVIPGHEIVGIIEKAPENNSGIIGKRVAIEPTISCGICQSCKIGLPHICTNLKVLGVHCNGGAAEYVKTSLNKIHFVPDSLSDEQSALIEPVSVSIHVVKTSKIQFGDNVLIIGSGPIGLLIAQVCKFAGAKRISVMEINDFRKGICKNMGFEVLENEKSVEDIDYKYDIGYEVSGSEAGVQKLMEMVRPGGKIIIVGLFKNPIPIQLSSVLFKELEIKGSRVYSSMDFKLAIELLNKGMINTKLLLTNIVKLEDFAYGVELALKKEAMKVIVDARK
ncbi:MAG: alcohol dehydrogenase catalytic domain-containing protein [Actinobacteria bacterium]|nr:alcohol dehydrogenase catalytic domain-containing protein [Actinomycetota bacterium]